MTNFSTLITLVGSPPRLSHAETGVGPAIDQASEARSHGSLTLLTLSTSSRSTLKRDAAVLELQPHYQKLITRITFR